MNPILLTNSPNRPILRMDLAPTVADSTGELFNTAAMEFQRGIEVNIDFDPGYQLQEGECFQIRDFSLDPDIIAACRQPISVDRLQANEIGNLPVKSVVGYSFDANKQEIYFQNFDSSRVVIPGKRGAFFSTADSSTFQELQGPVILLNTNLAAIWRDNVLTFKSFHLARRIFDLSAYFQAATDEQVKLFASSSRFVPSNPDAVLTSCSEWHRNKIALLLRSGDLENFSIPMLTAAAESVGYEVPMEGERIRLPSDKNELRMLLQFLDEDIYLGPFSRRQLISSGKRMGRA